MLRIFYRQECDGSIWQSESFEFPTLHHVKQGVIAGFLHGAARQAVDATTGAVLFGLDRKGNESKAPL